VYYLSEAAREVALAQMQPWLISEELAIEGERRIIREDKHKCQDMYGLDMPECVMRQAYIITQEISFIAGWETGRQSEPVFMNMNLRAACGCSLPKVVLYQMDTDNPMNPHGIVVAYDEDSVKPVVSDFDTFLVGSTHTSYETLEQNQQELALWTLDETEKILEKNNAQKTECSWSKSWMTVLQSKTGPDPVMPEYGFGDATSCRLIKAIVGATRKTGAVRHGAECFNYWFPQELDDEYLIVWEGFQMMPGCERDPPWKYMQMDDLHKFLLERIDQGYSFPLNPVWPVRDPGWFQVHMKLMRSEASKGPCDAWYPQGSGIREKINRIHDRFPKGFQRAPTTVKGSPSLKRTSTRVSLIEDVDTLEHADVLHFTVRPSALWSRARWKVFSVESIRHPFTPRKSLRSPRPSFCPRLSGASSGSRLSTRRGTSRTLGEDLDDRQRPRKKTTEEALEPLVGPEMSMQETAATSGDSDRYTVFSPKAKARSVPVPQPLSLTFEDFDGQPAILRNCSTPGRTVAKLEESERQLEELVRNASSTPNLSSFHMLEMFENDDVRRHARYSTNGMLLDVTRPRSR